MVFAQHREGSRPGGLRGHGAGDTGLARGEAHGAGTGRGTRGWHAAAAAAGCQVAMVTSRRDAAPINSQFEVILLKELFFPVLFL